MSFYNPLSHVFETKTYPHARALRSSFLEKLLDTWLFFSGNNAQIGFIDCITLFIPLFYCAVIDWCYKKIDGTNGYISFAAHLLLFPFSFIGISVASARLLLGLFVAILLSPLVALVHLCAVLISEDSNAQFLSLEGELRDGRQQTLEEYMIENKTPIDDLDINVAPINSTNKKGSETLPRSYQLKFWRRDDGYSTLVSPCDGRCLSTCDEHGRVAPFVVKINGADKKQAANIHALFALNVGHVVSDIERQLDSCATQNLLNI